jgi:hypothetical protein
MSALDRLIALRRSIAATVVARALLIGIAAAIVAITVGRMAGLGVWSAMLPLAAFVVACALSANTLRSSRSLSRVALWVEERTPSLRYALVTVADGVHSPALEAQALSTPWWTDARRTLLRSLVAPAAAAIVVSALALWLPSLVHIGLRGLEAGSARAAAEAARVTDVLAVVHAAVTPPAYANRTATTLVDPTNIEALVGSAIVVSGNGEASRLTATADSAPRSVAQRGAGWSLALTMPARPALVRLHSDAGRDRLVVLAPVIDAPPAVTLLLPARDTILRRATGTLGLRAQLRDDIGLRDADFELVVSTGSGENFTFRMAVIAHTQLQGRAESLLEGRLSLDSLKLEPGDLLQIRAVARDANNVTGPGVGSSETRSIRVARADEYDSVAVRERGRC